MLLSANIFQPLIDVFAAVIKFFAHDVGLSWGWSIILLTICVRLVMMPLTVKQFHSMRRLQQHQPEMKAIQQKYKEDKQRQQQELMKFYQTNGINPLASCLPLVAQLPVFISLFYMLRKNLRTDICPAVQQHFQSWYASAYHVSAKVAEGQTTFCTTTAHHLAQYYHGGAGFLFINDITNEAHGAILVLLCVIYVGTQMASTLLMSAPTMDKTQRRMMAFMPVIFVLFIIRFPAGLLVYWITTNTWTMAQQFTLKKIIGAPIVPEVIDAGPVSGGSHGAGKAGGGTGRSTAKSPGYFEASDDGAKPSAGKRISSMFTPRANREATAAASEKSGSSAVSAKSSSSGSGAAKRGTPPPPPRKKKKRSGRKR